MMKWNILPFAVAFAVSAGAELRVQAPGSEATVQNSHRRAAQTIAGPMLARYLWDQETNRTPGPALHAPPGYVSKDVGDKDVLIQDGAPVSGKALNRSVLERKGKDVANGRNVVAGLQFDPRYLEGTDRDVSNFVQPGEAGFLEGTDKDVTSHHRSAPQGGNLRIARYLWQQGSTPLPPRAGASTAVRYNAQQRVQPKAQEVARYLWQQGATPLPPQAGARAAVRYNAQQRVQTKTREVARYLWQDAGQDSDARGAPQVARYLWGNDVRRPDAADKRMQMARYLWDEDNGGGVPDKRMQVARYLWQGKSDDLGHDNGLKPARLRNTVAMFLWRDDRGTRDAPHLQQPYMDNLAPQYTTERNNGAAAWDAADTYQAIASIGQPILALKKRRFIVVSKDVKALKVHLSAMGASVEADLSLINAVAVSLTRKQMIDLSRDPNVVSITADRPVHTADSASGVAATDVPNSDEVQQGMHRQTFFTRLIQADELQREGVTGRGVTVAVVDTGLWKNDALMKDTSGRHRVLAYYDAIQNRTSVPIADPNGHGSHIASVIASSEPSYDNGRRTGSWQGVAPDANLVVVRAFDEQGRGTYMNVIRAIAYVIAHKKQYNIKVVNLSFASVPRSHYWQDPLDLAVMAAWRAGIVVIVSSGNSGSDAQTIGAPGNVPYVITVGAMTDHYTLKDTSDDYLAPFSSRGPTMEGFVKPEIIAPGGHLTGIMSPSSYIAREHPEFSDGGFYFLMSGTSQAAAVASGVAALMLQVNPALTPDDVKCRLMSSARVAHNPDGSLGYSVFEQGAGLVNAMDAVASKASGCANQGLDIARDMDNTEHYGGPARRDSNGNFNLASAAGYNWNVSDVESNGGYTWDLGNVWNASTIWNMGYVWDTSALVANGNMWDETDFASNGYQWDMAGLVAKGYILDMSALTPASQPPASTAPAGNGPSWQQLVHRSHGSVWDIGNVADAGFTWNVAFNKNNGYIWNLGYLWNLGDANNAGYIWNLGTSKNAGYIWNLNSAQNSGYIWNLNNSQNAGYFWNLNNAQNAGYFWNLNNAQNAGYFWNLGSGQNAGYFWNLNSSQNAGYFWNLNSAQSAGYFWNLANAVNDGYLWNLNNSQNAGYFWNLNNAQNAGYFWNLNNSQNAGYFWNLNSSQNAGYFWNLNNSQNAGYFWNLSMATNAGYFWNLSAADNTGYFWNLSSAQNTGNIANMSVVSTNQWVAQE